MNWTDIYREWTNNRLCVLVRKVRTLPYMLQYDSGTKRRPGISKNFVFIRAVESQVIRDCNSTSRNQNQSQIRTIIKTV